METYESLKVFKESHLFVLELYKVVEKFPKKENFRLSDQICRSAISIPANIAEAFGRHSVKERMYFLYISRGSIEETKYYLLLTRDLSYLNPEEFEKMKTSIDKIGKMLNALITSFKYKLNTQISKQPDN